MMLTLCLLLGVVAGLFGLVLVCATKEPPPAPRPSRPLGQELPPCLGAWLEMEEEPYDPAGFDRQITRMLESTARWQQQAQDRRTA